MKAVSLFAGGGGMDFALRSLNVDVVFANDISDDAVRTLKAYFPEADTRNDDIRTLEQFPSADIVVGGYPCQSFSLGGRRKPSKDSRSYLYLEFARAVSKIRPKFFVAENVSGLAGVEKGAWFRDQLTLFEEMGDGYVLSHKLLRAHEYGIPQKRKRIFIVGVRSDLGLRYLFPDRTHGSEDDVKRDRRLRRFSSHGEAIRHLPLHPTGEYYERPHDPNGHMSWYFMSRNRKADWFDPSFCIVANFRHITLHPACQSMRLTWSNLKDGFKQRWDFSGEYEHLKIDPTLPVLEVPRRLSWREAAAIQTFPVDYEPVGDLESKFEQIGNAVPPRLFRHLIEGIVTGRQLQTTDNKLGQEGLEQLGLFGT